MKPLVTTVAFLFTAFLTCAQGTSERKIMFHTFANDSIVLALNSDYFLIEDDCAQIIRYAHYNFQDRIFTGPFKDVSKQDTNLVVSEGSYNDYGKKDGLFTANYFNGNLRAKGIFKDNAYDGKWELFYENGKPELTFEVTAEEYTITDAWKADGSKLIDKGNGTFTNNMGGMYWKGKLLNGKPDGTWKLMSTNNDGNTLYTEHFKKGVFENGTNSSGTYTYTDKSHVQFISRFKMPLINAENMYFSPLPCNGKKIVQASYKDGWRALNAETTDLVGPYINTVDIKDLDNSFVIEGEISARGELSNMHSRQAFREDLARGIINRLKNIRGFSPATIDGKPTVQKFAVKFIFTNSIYQFGYQFHPVAAD